jgi:hypothetical protein
MLNVGNGYQFKKSIIIMKMQTVNLIKNPEGHSFALCESCFWCATILDNRKQQACPACTGSVSLIPLARDEKYRIKLESTMGLEMSFSKRAD